MSYFINKRRRMYTEGDNKRDSGYSIPENVEVIRDIAYGPHGRLNLLDVCRPRGAAEKLPVIIDIHGGGFFYGDKERYSFYCADIAKRGFAVINFNYRLAPESRFPKQLEDIDAAVRWTLENGDKYGYDTDNLFLAGDSAGAQLLMTYLSLAGDADYARKVGITPPEGFKPRGAALNCGLYEMSALDDTYLKRLTINYVGLFYRFKMSKLDATAHINEKFPNTYLMTSNGDFLKSSGIKMDKLLTERGVPHVFKIYGDEDKTDLQHVFHVDIGKEAAILCNDEECAFFRGLMC